MLYFEYFQARSVVFCGWARRFILKFSPGRNMNRLASLIFVAGAFASMALASSVTLSLHTTGDTPIIDLSTILNQWGTPGDTTDTFTIGGTGTDKIAGLNLVNDTGLSITSIALFAYGTVGSNTFGSLCANDSGSPF